MSLWRQLLDRIFDTPFGKIDPVEQAQAEARGAAVEQQLLNNMKAAQEEDSRRSRRGKNWEFIGDRLHLEGFPITIRRATTDEVKTKPGIFCVECETLIPFFVWEMEDAKFIGERWAKEIDALPLTPKQEGSPVVDDSDNRILTPDAELPRRGSPGRHAVIDSTEEPRRQESGDEPLTPDYDPKRGPRR